MLGLSGRLESDGIDAKPTLPVSLCCSVVRSSSERYILSTKSSYEQRFLLNFDLGGDPRALTDERRLMDDGCLDGSALDKVFQRSTPALKQLRSHTFAHMAAGPRVR